MATNKKKDEATVPEDRSFGTLLKWFRTTHRNLSQQGLARKIRMHPNTISAWESHRYLPATRETVLALAHALSIDDTDTDRLLFAAQYPLLGEHERTEPKQMKATTERQTESRDGLTVAPPLWNVPHRRNPYFTGRQTLLTSLHDALSKQKTVAVTHPQAISGLGGIGKTQVALEYAYRYRRDYHYVFWVHADSRETLLSDFVGIANLLNLPEKAERDQTRIVKAVKRWCDAHTTWLFILDNADDLAALHEYMPTLGEGHILLTTRAHSIGLLAPHPIELDVMDQEEGALLLLRRAGILSIRDSLNAASERDRALAHQLVQEVGGLPLALDQAGAYIEETACGLARYLELYHTHHAEVLKRHDISSGYPHSVATTWSLSFKVVEANNVVAAEILRLCSFLQPDAIPEDIFTEGGDALGSILSRLADTPLALDTAIETLLRYSLIKRNPETRTVTIHRLVQVVLKDSLSIEQLHQWAGRTIRTINRIFPEVELAAVNDAVWPKCELYLPHVQINLSLKENDDITFLEAAQLLQRAGSYVYIRGRYKEAEPLLEEALTIFEKVLGSEHTEVSKTLNILGRLYRRQGKYDESERCYRRALALREKALGPEHSDVAGILNNLGLLYENQGKYALAEPLFQRALAIREHALGPEDPLVANVLNNLGLLYEDQGRLTEAQPLLERALGISEKTLGANHLDTALTLNDLGVLYRKLGKYSEAEHFYQRALAVWRQVYGPEHPNAAATLLNIATLNLFQKKYVEAEPLFKHGLSILKKAFGSEHPDVAKALIGLGEVRAMQENYAEAEAYYQQALLLREKAFGSESEDVADSLACLADLYARQEKYTEAKQLFERAIRIQEYVLGTEHPDTMQTKKRYTALQHRVHEQNASSPKS